MENDYLAPGKIFTNVASLQHLGLKKRKKKDKKGKITMSWLEMTRYVSVLFCNGSFL